LAGAVCAFLGLGTLLMVRLIDGGVSRSATAFVAVLELFLFVLIVTAGGLWSKREIFEIDSRFVTVTRGDALVGFSPRAQCLDAWLLPVPKGHGARIARRLVAAPRIALGVDGGSYMLFGAGVSDHAASEVLSLVAGFMVENPPEPGFDFAVESGAR